MNQQNTQPSENYEVATLAGGCFWCLEAIFEQVKGVRKVVSGYSGGTTPDPSYDQVSMGNTGHAESIQVTYDPKVIPFKDILEIFFTFHDPTTLNRQGPDHGTQYRSAIFYHDAGQKVASEQFVAKLEAEHLWADPIVTQIDKLDSFYPAEGYHQHYYARNSDQPYCQAMIAPKLAKLRQKYASRLKTEAE